MIILAAPTWVILLLLFSFIFFIALIGLIIFIAHRNYERTNIKTQVYLTDRELLMLISNQPDGMMTAKRLAGNSTLTLKQSKTRLSYLMQQGVLGVAHDNKFKYHYSLKEEIDERPQLELSDDPFLTVEDILFLFKHHDFQLTYQKACISTGLPVAVIKREFNYFVKQKIMNQVYSSTDGITQKRLFLLEEPYRSDPDKFLEREKKMNLELERIYVKEMRR